MSVLHGEMICSMPVKGSDEEHFWVEQVTTPVGLVKFAVFGKDEAGDVVQIERYNELWQAVRCAGICAIDRTAYLCGGGK